MVSSIRDLRKNNVRDDHGLGLCISFILPVPEHAPPRDGPEERGNVPNNKLRPRVPGGPVRAPPRIIMVHSKSLYVHFCGGVFYFDHRERFICVFIKFHELFGLFRDVIIGHSGVRRQRRAALHDPADDANYKTPEEIRAVVSGDHVHLNGIGEFVARSVCGHHLWFFCVDYYCCGGYAIISR